MNNVVEIATIAFAFIFYASLIVKQHIAYRVAECGSIQNRCHGQNTANSGNSIS